jgi:hypothetical protein
MNFFFKLGSSSLFLFTCLVYYFKANVSDFIPHAENFESINFIFSLLITWFYIGILSYLACMLIAFYEDVRFHLKGPRRGF